MEAALTGPTQAQALEQTPPRSQTGSESSSGKYSDPFGEELYLKQDQDQSQEKDQDRDQDESQDQDQDQETPHAETFRKDLPAEDRPESPLAKKEVSRITCR